MFPDVSVAPYMASEYPHLFYVGNNINTQDLWVQLMKDAGIEKNSFKWNFNLEMEMVLVWGREQMQFVRHVSVCACHLGPDDVVQEGQQRSRKATWVLSKTARLCSPKQLHKMAICLCSQIRRPSI